MTFDIRYIVYYFIYCRNNNFRDNGHNSLHCCMIIVVSSFTAYLELYDMAKTWHLLCAKQMFTTKDGQGIFPGDESSTIHSFVN